jgi:hypothetical protein
MAIDGGAQIVDRLPGEVQRRRVGNLHQTRGQRRLRADDAHHLFLGDLFVAQHFPDTECDIRKAGKVNLAPG